MAADEVWKETVLRLNRRENPKWESLSWVALRPLISSLNDKINRAAPDLVDDLRRSWMQKTLAREGVATIDVYQGIVDRSDTESFLVMGDTGEQDASQYVLGPALRAAMNPPGSDGDGADFLLICSDVIYPSGDINDYTHGFYLPYEDLLYPEPTGSIEPTERTEPTESWTPPGPAGPQRIYALPGNHDWYDGLTGFMHTFCGLDRLGPDSYIWQASRWRKLTSPEILGRMLWRRPSRPRPTRLTPTDQYAPIAAVRDQRMGRFDPKTGQPGPYYAIQVKGLLLVCIDGGIGSHGDCTIDSDQARWLIRISRSKQPKVLLTGYPLLVNGEWKRCRIRWESPQPDGTPATVNEIVADPAHGYVASIGGDVHNFQYYDVQVGDPASSHRVRYLVSGGGGAYISATHPGPGAIARTVADLHGEAPTVRAANALSGGGTVSTKGSTKGSTKDRLHRLGPEPDAGIHPLIPTPERSLSRFAERVIPKTWRLIRALIAFFAAAVLGTVLARAVPGFAPGQGLLWRSNLVLLACLGFVLGALAYRIFVLGPPRVLELDADRKDDGRRRLYRRAITAFAAVSGFAVPLIAARVGPQSWFGYLVCWEFLTGLGILLAMLQRFSGWWREPAGDGGADHPLASAAMGTVALVLTPLLLHLTDVLPFTGSRRWWIIGSALCVVVPAVIGWPLRSTRGWRSSSRWVAPLAQVSAAMIFLSTLPGKNAFVRPIAVPAGLVLSLGLLLAAAVLCMLIISVPILPRPQRRLARNGRFAPSLIAVLLPIALIALTMLSERLGAEQTWPTFVRMVIVVAWGVMLTVLGVFGVDTLRRTLPGSYRIWATLVGILVTIAIIRVPLENHWLAAGLVVSGLGLILVAVTVTLVYLSFLGGHALLFDRAAHLDLGERPDFLIDEAQARQVIEWRRTQGRHQITDKRLERRAKFVTPSTDKPEGLIQQKVSEFFSTDQPPFSQHFLEIRVRTSTLEITPRLVTGDATAGTEPGVTIAIPLP